MLLVLAGADTFRRPDRQVTARLYVGAVRSYQHYGRSLLSGFVACRYKPTCSAYSIQAVEKYGIQRGLVLRKATVFVHPGRAVWHFRSSSLTTGLALLSVLRIQSRCYRVRLTRPKE